MPAVQGPQSADPDVAFGKYLIDQGILSKKEISEAYKLLVGYRKKLPNVNLAQVLARHGMGTKEALRDAYQRFKSQGPGDSGAFVARPPSSSGAGSGVGSGVGFFPTGGNASGSGSFPSPPPPGPGGSGFGSGLGPPPSGVGSGLGPPPSGIGAPPASGMGSGFGQGAVAESRFGFKTVELTDREKPQLGSGMGSAFGSGFGKPGSKPIPATIDPDAGPKRPMIPPTIDPDGGGGFNDEGATIIDRAGAGAFAPPGSGLGVRPAGPGSGFGPGAGSGFGGGPGSGSAFGGPGTGLGPPPGSGFGGSGPAGSNFGPPGSAFGSGPGGSAFGPGPGGSGFGGSGPGSALARSPAGTGFGPGGSAFGPGGSAFGPGGSAFGSGKPKIDLPEAPPVGAADLDLSDSEEEEDRRGNTNVESSVLPAKGKKKGKGKAKGKAKGRSRAAAFQQPPQKKLPMGLLAGVGAALVLIVGILVSSMLSNKRLEREVASFIAAASEKAPQDALKIGEGLSSDALENPEVKKLLAELKAKVKANEARTSAAEILAKLTQTQNLQERLDICNKAVSADETYARAYVERARVKYSLEKRKALQSSANTQRLYATAMVDLGEAQKHEQNDPWLHFVRAEILLESVGDPDARMGALRNLAKVKDLDESGALGALAKGRLEELKRNFDKALGHYDQAIQKDPKLVDAYVARADTHLSKQDYPKALADAKTAFELDKTSAKALTLLAWARFRARKDRAGALKDLNEALRLDPTQIRALALRSYVQLKRTKSGDLKSDGPTKTKSSQDAEQALRLDDGQYMAHLALAEINLDNQNLSKALHHAGKAVEGSQAKGLRFDEAFLVRGRLRVRDGDHDHALSDFEEVLDINPNNARALTMKAGILMQRGDFEQARHLLDQALEINHKLPQAHFNKGYMNLLARPRNFRKAIDDFSKAIGIKPEFAEAFFYRGVAYYEAHRFEDCLNDLKQAEELRTKKAAAGVNYPIVEVAYVRGMCHFYREEWSKAVTSLKKFIKKAPVGHAALKKAKARMKTAQERLAGKGPEKKKRN